MASYIAAADSNFNTGSTWHTVDATSFLDSEAGNDVLTTSFVSSEGFTPGAITVDGIAVKIASRVASPSGTMSIRLRNVTDALDVKTVTINVADLPTCGTTNNEGGWMFFKFDAPTLLIAAKEYRVQATTSVATQVYLYRNAVAANWSRMLRTTTDAASPPAAASILHIMEEKTGAGAATIRTVTMDAIAAAILDYGSGTDASACLTISDGGTLNYGFTAATAYYLKLSGNLIVYNGGTLTIGTVANPIPRDGSAVLEFDPVADGGMGRIYRNGSNIVEQGLSRTLGKNIVSCKLNTDAAAGATVLNVDTDTGWLAGDEIGIASTSRTYSQCERRTLSVNASATELTVTSGLTNAHSGTSPTQAEVILLTRNVKIRAASSTIQGYITFTATSTVDIDWVEFYYLGQNGIGVATTTGSFNMQYSSIYDAEKTALSLSGASGDKTFSNNVLYNLNSTNTYGSYPINLAASSGATVMDSNIFMLLQSPSSSGIERYATGMGDVGMTFTNNTVCGVNGAAAISIMESASQIGTFSGNTIHSCSDSGLCFSFPGSSENQLSSYGTITDLTIWRCGGSADAFAFGIKFNLDIVSTKYTLHINNLTFNNAVLFGNLNANIGMRDFDQTEMATKSNITFNSGTFNGDSSFATTNGVIIEGYCINLIFNSCDFSTASGIKTAHTNDININASRGIQTLFLNNCKLAGTNEVTGQTNLLVGSFIKSTKHDQTAGTHKSWFKYGIIASDSVANMFRTAAPSARLTPNNASNKLESGSFKVNVNSGQTCTPSVYVRESVVGDGTDYNGARIRIILKRNDAIGITADTVLDTATVASEGAFEEIGAVTPAASENGVMEFVIDCSGTTGWVNVDDFSAVVA